MSPFCWNKLRSAQLRAEKNRKTKNMRLSRLFAVLLSFVLVLPLAAQANQDWATPAEKADYRTTPNYDETMAYVRRVAAAAPKQVKVISFGKTGEGRDLWAVIVSKDGVF